MKNLYSLNEEEKNRILNLHESVSKKQYLSEANEKGGAGYVDPATDTPDAKIARKFYQAAAGPGTNESNMLTAIQSITSAVQFWKVNELVKNLPGNSGKLDIAGVINDEMGRDNLEDVNKIIESLKTAGITATRETEKRKLSSGGTIETFKENTFKITSQPVAATPVKTAAELDAAWATTYKCVTIQPGVKSGKMKDGSTYYQIGTTYYYSNGYKRVNGRPSRYTCDEFKGNVVNPKVGYQERAKQVNLQTINTTKKIQELLGQQQTGKLDSGNVERMIDLLKQ